MTLPQVVWLDVTASKSRYGVWLGASLPEFVPFPKTGKARGGAAKQRAAAAANGASGGAGGLWEDDDKFLVRLRRLKCAALRDAYHRAMACH